MRYLAWILALSLLPFIGSHAAPSDATESSITDLLDSAQLWQVRRRPDLARGVLRKVLAVRADEPRALLLLGELDLRSGRKDAALAELAILQARHPGSAELEQLQQLAALYSNDQLRLTRLQQLRDAGRNAEAGSLARQIFPSARPPGLWGIELAGLIASTPGAWEVSRKQAEERVASSGTALDRLALAEVLAQRPATRERAWSLYGTLARDKQLPAETVASSWRRALRLQPKGTAVGPLWASMNQAMGTIDSAPPTATGQVAAAIGKADNRKPPPPAPKAPPDPRAEAIALARGRAQVLLDTEANEAAAELLEASLAQHGEDGPSRGLLGLARMRLGQHAQAVPHFESALTQDPADANRWRGLANTARYWATVRQARDDAALGQVEPAANLLRPILDTETNEIEAPLLLADLEARLGQRDAALQHYGKVLKTAPREERAWRGRFNVHLEIDPEAAIDELALFGPGAAELLDAGSVRDQADNRLAHGRAGAALRLLEQAIALAPSDPWLRHDAARIYLQMGLKDEARTLMAEGRAQPGSNAEMLQASAIIALAADEHDLAVNLLAGLPAAEVTPAQRDLAHRARVEQALDHARSALAERRVERAKDWLDTAEPLIDDSAEQRMRVARLRLAADQPAQALTLLLPIDTRTLSADDTLSWAGLVADAGAAERAMDTLQARLDAPAADRNAASPAAWTLEERARARLLHADLAIDSGLLQAARLDARILGTELPADAIDSRLQLMRLQRRAGDLDGERDTLARLLRQTGDDPAVRIEAARLARQDEADAVALGHLQVARDRSPPGSASAIEAQSAIDAIEASRQPLLEFALHDGWLSGTPGQSQLDSREATMRLRWPAAARGSFFAQLDLIRLDAGTLAAPLAESEDFGRVLVQAGPAGLAAPSPQNDRGAAIGVGWSDRQNNLDIGLVNLRLRNLVGGWSHSARTDGGTGWGVELSRRILTGSLLSWAGAQDPTDGAVWGGVTLNALTLRTDRALSNVDSAFASLRVGVLQGTDVASNQMVQLRGGIDRDLLRAENERVRIGISANAMHYARNLSFETFGHGGYYSPQRYFSLGLPIEWAGMTGRLSYLVRAGVSHSWTHEDDAPYYPTDAQAQATAGNPVHAGGPGGGTGASLRATLEWRATPYWAVGASFGAERSTDYSPARAMVYARHWLGRVPAPLDWPPSPLAPYVRY